MKRNLRSQDIRSAVLKKLEEKGKAFSVKQLANLLDCSVTAARQTLVDNKAVLLGKRQMGMGPPTYFWGFKGAKVPNGIREISPKRASAKPSRDNPTEALQLFQALMEKFVIPGLGFNGFEYTDTAGRKWALTAQVVADKGKRGVAPPIKVDFKARRRKNGKRFLRKAA